MNKKLISGIVLLVGFVSLGFVLLSIITKEKQVVVDNAILLGEITKQIPAFSNNNEPVISVATYSRPEKNWYIATIKSVHTTDNFVPVKIILKNISVTTGTDLQIILGPDTHFTEADLLGYNIPDSVILELQKS